jgi:hypothetical protein
VTWRGRGAEEYVKSQGARDMESTVFVGLGFGREVPPAGLAGGKTVESARG